jgi:hypothetical protein
MSAEEFPSKARRYSGLEAAYDDNREYRQKAAKANKKAGQVVMPTYEGEDLREFFRSRLNGATKLAELPSMEVLRF